jgi:hypothetical protein
MTLPIRAWRPPPDYFAGRSAELALLDDFVAGDDTVCNVFGPGGIGKTELTLAWARQVTANGTLVALHDLTGGVAPAVLLQDWRRQIGDYEDVSSSAFHTFDTALTEHLLLDEVLASSGGAGVLFDSLGQLKDPTGLAAAVAVAGRAFAARLQRRVANRAALDRYFRSADRILAEAFCEALAYLADSHRPIVLILDTYEDAGPVDSWICLHLAPRMPAHTGLILTGRNELTRTNFDWQELSSTIFSLPVPELSVVEARAYLEHHGLLDTHARDRVLTLTGGYPLLLMLVCELGRSAGGWDALGELRARDRDDLGTQLLERILREERARPLRNLLERGCVSPWLDPGIICEILDVDRITARVLYDQLAQHSFSERHPRGLRLQEKIRDLLVARFAFTDPDGYDSLKQKLGVYFESLDRGLASAEPS